MYALTQVEKRPSPYPKFSRKKTKDYCNTLHSHRESGLVAIYLLQPNEAEGVSAGYRRRALSQHKDFQEGRTDTGICYIPDGVVGAYMELRIRPGAAVCNGTVTRCLRIASGNRAQAEGLLCWEETNEWIIKEEAI